MQYFLVDYENVHAEGITNARLLREGDTVVIMYSENCKNITIDVISELLEHGATIKCFKVSVGTKNALDFQLSSYLGYIIGQQQEEAQFYIVSRDTGYDRLCDFWGAQNVSLKRIFRMSGDTEAQPAARQPEPPKPKKKVTKVAESNKATLPEIEQYLQPEDSPAEILEIVNQYKTKQSIMRGISKKFKDSKKAGAVYKKLKPLLKEKKKT